MSQMRYAPRHRRPRPRGIVPTRLIAGLGTATGVMMGLALLIGISPAVGAHGPILIPGSPECLEGLSLRDGDGPPTPASNDVMRIGYPDETHASVQASTGFVIDEVIIKAGPNAAVYTDPPFVNLAAIINPAGDTAPIIYVEVCYSAESTTSTTTTDTTDIASSSTSEATTTTTTQVTTTSEVTPTMAPTTTAPTTTTSAPTTTAPTSTTSVPTITATTAPTTTTTTTIAPTTTAQPASAATNTVVSVLPTEIDQTVLPQTGLGDSWMPLLAAVMLLIGGSGVLLAADQMGRSRRQAFRRKL